MSAFTFERAVEITNEALKKWSGPEHTVHWLAGFIVGTIRKEYSEKAFKTESVEVFDEGIRLHGKSPSSMQAVEVYFGEDLLYSLGLKERPARFDRDEVV